LSIFTQAEPSLLSRANWRRHVRIHPKSSVNYYALNISRQLDVDQIQGFRPVRAQHVRPAVSLHEVRRRLSTTSFERDCINESVGQRLPAILARGAK